MRTVGFYVASAGSTAFLSFTAPYPLVVVGVNIALSWDTNTASSTAQAMVTPRQTTDVTYAIAVVALSKLFSTAAGFAQTGANIWVPTEYRMARGEILNCVVTVGTDTASAYFILSFIPWAH